MTEERDWRKEQYELADFDKEYGMLAYTFAEVQNATKPATSAVQNYIASKFRRRLDFPAIGRGFGIKGHQINEAFSLHKVLLEAFSCPGPSIVDICVDETQNVLPIVPPGAANRDMIPDLSMERVCREIPTPVPSRIENPG